MFFSEIYDTIKNLIYDKERSFKIMKKCSWCNSKIEDDIKICPFCKATQNVNKQSISKNYVESYLEKHPKWKQEKRKILIECPTCHSTNTQVITTKERVVSVAMLGLFSKKINKSFKCNNCGYTW